MVVNPRNDWIKQMTVAELERIWEPEAQGKITRWSHVNPKWPNAGIKLFGPGADSGTLDYFTEAVNGKSKASHGDFSTPSGTSASPTTSRTKNGSRPSRS